MSKTPRVSIIVPNYNHELFLEKRLDSIFTQTFTDYEVILLDDASSDNSISILEKYADHPSVSHFIINDTNSGSPFLQWKKGLSLAKGEFIWIAESDDYCDSNFLEILVPHCEAHAVAVAKTLLWYPANSESKVLTHPIFKDASGKPKTLSNDSILYCPALNVSALLFKKPSKDKLKDSLFNKYNIIGDRVFYFEFFQHTTWYYEENTQNYFRQHGEGLSDLDAKDINYLKAYFKEHLWFINYASKAENLSKAIQKSYAQRFFNRVRNRLTRKDKLSIAYLRIVLMKLFFKNYQVSSS